MGEAVNRGSEEVRQYLNALSQGAGLTAQPRPEAVVTDPSLPAIYNPVSAYEIRGELHVFFLAGEYDYEDTRLLAVIARWKTLLRPLCRTVFLNVPAGGEPVKWLSEPTMAAALVAAAWHSVQNDPLNPAKPAEALLQAIHQLLGLIPGRMGEGLAQLDQILGQHLLPAWTLAASGRDLLRPTLRGLNYLLRRALNEVLPPEVEIPGEPLMTERLRLWKHRRLWYRFQSLEFIEDMFQTRTPGLRAAYDALYALTQNPDAAIDRIRFRVITAPEDPQNPERLPFPGGSGSGSSLRGEFLVARRAMREQHGLDVPDLVWAVAECGACKSRSQFRQSADPLAVYAVAHATDRIKKMLVGGQRTDTFRCSRCRQPLGFDHLVLAAYAHYLADLDIDLHFLNERRPGRRKTWLQTIQHETINTRALPITDEAVAKTVSRPLSAVGLWRALLEATAQTPLWREFIPGLVGLCLPPGDPLKQSAFVARFHDQLVQRARGYWPVALTPAPNARSGEYPHWLGPLATKVTAEKEYRLYAFVDLDRIEELFVQAAQRLDVKWNRALDGTLEVRGPDLSLPVDLKAPVQAALHRGHFPGVFAAREAARQARLLASTQKTLAGIREYLGQRYSVNYNPSTREVVIEGSFGLPSSFPLEMLVQEWAENPQKVKQIIIGKVGA